MRICFSIGTFFYSGAEKIMLNLIKKFVENGDDISVILISTDREYDGLDNVHQYPLYQYYKKDEPNKIKRTLLNHASIWNIVNKEKFDIIVSFGCIFNVDIMESFISRKTKIVLCERNDPVFDPPSRILRIRRMLSYPRADAFVFQTDEIKSFFSKSIQKRAHVIPNFMEDKIPDTQQWNQKRNAFATSARLDDRQKDQSTMIRAFSGFINQHPDYQLEIYGEGPDRKKYEKIIEDLSLQGKVLLQGRVDNPMHYIRTARAFILSSVYEGMPNSLIEAMAYGMPCISTDCSGGGARALIRNGENGLLVPVGDVKALEEAMNEIADNDVLVKKLSDNAKKVNDSLNIDRIFSKWNDLVHAVGKSK